MPPFLIVLHIGAAVMLLLWSVRFVQKGVERSLGAHLRRFLRAPVGGRTGIALSGLLLAILMQSATAVSMLAAGFVSAGTLSTPMGIAALIGADLGSAIVVRMLSFDLSEAVPVLLLLGAGLQVKARGARAAEIGRILLGCALLLLSIRMIGTATEPLRHSPFIANLLERLVADPWTAMAVAALFTWAMHSSVATLILLGGLAQSGALPVEAALPMVIGTNLGGALTGVILTRGLLPRARRIPLANLLLRSLIGGLSLIFLPTFVALPALQGGAGVITFHLLFNAALLAGLPFVRWLDRLAALIQPDARVPGEDGPDRLQRALLDRPALALGAASRELIAMGDLVARMLHPVMEILDGRAQDEITGIRTAEEAVNAKHTALKLYVAEVNRGAAGGGQSRRRALDVVDFAISLEHAGDLIAKTLLPLADTRRQEQLRFSAEGRAEIAGLHARVQTNMQLALNVLASGEVESARALAREKEIVRAMERNSRERHLERLQSGRADSIDTSDLHLEILRSLKEINSLIVTAAYPILDRSGLLRASRLREAS